jgi:hypothetical protein
LLASFKANMARRVVQINGCAHDRADRPDLLSQGGVEGSNFVGQSVSDGTPIAELGVLH